MPQLASEVKQKINKQILQPVVYSCNDYHEFRDVQDTLAALFSKVIFKEIGYMDSGYVALFKTRGVDSKQIESELEEARKEYDNRD